MSKRKKKSKPIKSILPPDPDGNELELDEEPFDELPPVVEESDDEKVGPEVEDERCVFCDAPLTAAEIDADIERCRAAGWPVPVVGERGCGKSACKAERKSLNTIEYEAPRIEDTDRRVDFIHATSHELGDLFNGRPLGGVPLHTITPPRPDKVGSTEPATPEFPEEVLAVYEQWFRDSAPDSLKHPWGRFHVTNRRELLRYIVSRGEQVTPASLSAAVENCQTLYILPGYRTTPAVTQENQKLPKKKVGRPKKEKVVEAPQDNIGFRWLRRELNLTARQIAKYMKHENFNAPTMSNDTNLLATDPKLIKELERIRAMEASNKYYEETITNAYNRLKNRLPLKAQRPFTANQVQFYLDYASGNYTEKQLVERHGSDMLSGLITLENDIIRRLAFVGIVRIVDRPVIPRGEADEVDLQRDWDLENQAILRGAADGGTILGGKINYNTGKYHPLWSFEIAQHTYVDPSGQGGAKGGGTGPDYDQNGDDSEGFTPD